MRYLVLFITLILFSQNILAAPRKSGVLKVRLSNNGPLLININNRDYKKYATSLTVGDLPRGWHTLRVYEYLEYKNGGGRAKLIYTGDVRIKKDMITYFVVDPGTGRAQTSINELGTQPVSRSVSSGKRSAVVNTTTLTDMELEKIEQRVDSYATDNERIEIITSELYAKTYTTTQVKTMVEWLAFDDSKLDFAKWTYNSTSDKENYTQLKDVFTLKGTKEDFEEFLKD